VRQLTYARSFVRLALLMAAGMFALGSSAGVVGAQTETTTVRGAPPGRAAGRAERALQRQDAGPRQKALADQVRQAFAGVVRTRLNLTDEQTRQLQTTDRRFQQQRNQVGREERQVRVALAAALADTVGTPDQGKIGQYVDQLIQAQHRRADLLEAEQKELSAFLTPLQRARYLALREQLGRKVKQLQQDGPRRGKAPLY
jgi:hypothetical protein